MKHKMERFFNKDIEYIVFRLLDLLEPVDLKISENKREKSGIYGDYYVYYSMSKKSDNFIKDELRYYSFFNLVTSIEKDETVGKGYRRTPDSSSYVVYGYIDEIGRRFEVDDFTKFYNYSGDDFEVENHFRDQLESLEAKRMIGELKEIVDKIGT